jgi:hypothetical protein
MEKVKKFETAGDAEFMQTRTCVSMKRLIASRGCCFLRSSILVPEASFACVGSPVWGIYRRGMKTYQFDLSEALPIAFERL